MNGPGGAPDQGLADHDCGTIVSAGGEGPPSPGGVREVLLAARPGAGPASFYGVDGPALVFVRPDGHVAYLATSGFAAAHAAFLAQIAPVGSPGGAA